MTTGRVDRDEDGYPEYPTVAVNECGNCWQACDHLFPVYKVNAQTSDEIDFMACSTCWEEAMQAEAAEAVEAANAEFYRKANLSETEAAVFGKLIKEVA